MNDTPRTDKEAFFPHDSKYRVCDDDFARQLERELNAANQRIKRLEEAGNAMFPWSERVGQEFWLKAREAKL